MFEFDDCIVACCETVSWEMDDVEVAFAVLNSLSHLEPARQPINDLLDTAIVTIVGGKGPLEKLWGQSDLYSRGGIEAVKHASITKIKVSVDRGRLLTAAGVMACPHHHHS